MSSSKKVEISEYEVESLVIDKRARKWCLLPYPDHPNGCPNYNKKPQCPPQSPVIEDFIHLGQKMWLIIAKYNLQAQEDRMRAKHTHWTKRQGRCVLYWQKSVVKHLREAFIKSCGVKGIELNKEFIEQSLVPEAMGVQVIKTAKRLKIPINPRPKTFVYKIALIGYPRQASLQRKNNLLDYFS